MAKLVRAYGLITKLQLKSYMTELNGHGNQMSSRRQYNAVNYSLHNVLYGINPTAMCT